MNMKDMFEFIKQERHETRAAISEIKEKADNAIKIMNDVYKESNKLFKKRTEMLSTLLDDGDPETILALMSKALEEFSKSPDEEIKNRIEDSNLKSCN
ncbi:MAG: hypothetical protein J6X78_03760 [Treponema sp.]|nr:hypothetical protein [Treponema sp.]